MSYNVTALDRSGRWATVYLAPDRRARVTDRAVVTNHQGKVEWPPYAAAIRSVERQERLEELLAASTDVPGVVAACLRPPLYATRFHDGFGTLYTAEYRPAEGGVTLPLAWRILAAIPRQVPGRQLPRSNFEPPNKPLEQTLLPRAAGGADVLDSEHQALAGLRPRRTVGSNPEKCAVGSRPRPGYCGGGRYSCRA